MQRLDFARKHIRRLAAQDRPGAIVLAEHAVDLHAAFFADPADKIIALDALARDFIRIGRLHPEITTFLQRVDDYILLLQERIVITPSLEKAANG